MAQLAQDMALGSVHLHQYPLCEMCSLLKDSREPSSAQDFGRPFKLACEKHSPPRRTVG